MKLIELSCEASSKQTKSCPADGISGAPATRGAGLRLFTLFLHEQVKLFTPAFRAGLADRQDSTREIMAGFCVP